MVDLERGQTRRPLLPEGPPEIEDYQPLAEPAGKAPGFNGTQRRSRDVPFAVIFYLCILAVAGAGIYAAAHRNPHFLELNRKAVLDDPASCVASTHEEILLNGQLWSQDFKHAIQSVAWAYVVPVLTSGASAFLLGFVFLALLQACPFFIVYTTVSFVVLFPAAAATTFYKLTEQSQKDSSILVIPGVITLLLGGIFLSLRRRLELTAKVLTTAAVSLQANLRLLLFVPVISIIQALLALTILACAAVAYTNGHLAPNPKLADPLLCGEHGGEPCCVWQPDQWVLYFGSICGVVLLWSTILAFQVRLYTVAATVAQWYYAEVGQPGSSSVTLSLKHALGPSFGTLCFSSLIAALVQLVRDAAQRARDQRGDVAAGESVVTLFLTCCLDCLLGLVEFLTKFTVITAAITGDAFCSAARETFDLLTRNALSTVVVDSVAGWVLGLWTFFFSLACGVAAGAFTYSRWKEERPPGIHSKDDVPAVAVLEGLMAFLVAQLTLSFFTSVIMNVVDTVYVCYARDRDLEVVTKGQVHEIYSQLPSAKPQQNVSVAQPVLPTLQAPPETGPSVGTQEPVTGYPVAYRPLQ